MRCHSDEVGEGVRLLQQLAVLVPRAAQLAAATHMGDDEHHAAVEQRQPRDREPWVLARFVGAVAVQQCRRGELEAGAVDDRHRHPRAVRGDRPVAAFDVVLGAVVAEHRLFAQQRPLTGGEVDVVDAHRGDERRRADPQLGRIPVGVAGQTRRHQLGFEGEVLRPAVGALGVERPQLDSRQRLAAVADHEVADERVDRVETDVVAVLDERAGGGRVARPAPRRG